MIDSFFKKIQNQLLVLLISSIVLPGLLLTGYSISVYSDALTQVYLEQMYNQGLQNQEKIINFLDNFYNDVLFLRKVPPIQGIIRARAGGGIDPKEQSSYDVWRQRLVGIFAAMLENNSSYMQLRYLNEKGEEMVRVDAEGKNITVIPPNQLQNKFDRSYFQETMKLSEGQVYVSPLELNQEQGVIEKPYKPVIRYATPIFDPNGEKKGIVIANIWGNPLIDLIKDKIADRNTEVFVVNQEGYYIYHDNSEKLWGLETGSQENIINDYDREIASQLIADLDYKLWETKTDFLNSYKINLNLPKNYYLKLIIQTDKQKIFAPINFLTRINFFSRIFTWVIVIILAIFQLRKLIKKLQKLVESISRFSMEIVTTLNQQERIINHQSLMVNDTTSTLKDVRQFAQETAQQAENVAKTAQQALTLADRGDRLVQETLNGIRSVQEKVAVISQQTQRLGNQTSQIGNITNLARQVSDIAKQTNMLALNAAVEAVRAGEQGKGFGVVATEIRKLSEESRIAAENINAIVPELETAIAATVQATQAGAKTLDTGVNIAEKAADAFGGVRQAANEVFISNQQMLLNANKQSVSMADLVKIMLDINQEAAEIVEAIGYTKQGVETLSKQAVDLKSLV